MMGLRRIRRLPLGLWLAVGLLPCCLQAAYPQSSGDFRRPGARLAFPDHGAIHALVIFIQHPEQADTDGEAGSDPETEWPYERSLGPDRRLPAWAEGGRLLAPPGAPPESFDEGSISAFYHLMSGGRFTLTGYVYPKVYFPEHPIGRYHDNRGALQNGAANLAHEILTSQELVTYLTRNPDGLNLDALDTYRNGTNTYVQGGDGLFDLIILIHRGIVLPSLRKLHNGALSSGSSITSLGVDTEYRPGFIDYARPETDGFSSMPVTLTGRRVIDNLTSGSGITVRAVTRKAAVRIIAHEIGHRQFGFYHTCDAPVAPGSDCIGIMGGAYITMSAPDRIKLGWARVVPVNVDSVRTFRYTFRDALASGEVYRLQSGKNACGDVIVEARTWNNFWDAPPDPAAARYLNDDGDEWDLFLPQEGLYLYKAPEAGNARCGGSRNPISDNALYSSLENSGEGVRLAPFQAGTANELNAFRVGGRYQVAYEPGQVYAAHTMPRFFFHRNGRLDGRLSITGIRKEGDGFSADIWTDYLSGPGQNEALFIRNRPEPFDDVTLIDYETPAEADARVEVYDLLGRKLRVLVAGRHQAGRHTIRFDAAGLAAGVYVIRIFSDGRSRAHLVHYVP